MINIIKNMRGNASTNLVRKPLLILPSIKYEDKRKGRKIRNLLSEIDINNVEMTINKNANIIAGFLCIVYILGSDCFGRLCKRNMVFKLDYSKKFKYYFKMVF